MVQGSPLPEGSPMNQIPKMTKQMEEGHIEAIGMCQAMVKQNPGEELWALELLDVVGNQQYFRVVNASLPREQKPADMDEKTFLTHMVNTTVYEVKKDLNIPQDHLFYCLFIMKAEKAAEMTPEQMHMVYIKQSIALGNAIRAAQAGAAPTNGQPREQSRIIKPGQQNMTEGGIVLPGGAPSGIIKPN